MKSSTEEDTHQEQQQNQQDVMATYLRNGEFEKFISLIDTSETLDNDNDDDGHSVLSFLCSYRENTTNGNILHKLCHNHNTTSDMIDSIMRQLVNHNKNNNNIPVVEDLLLQQNWLGQTPLHVAIGVGCLNSMCIRSLLQFDNELSSGCSSTRVVDYEYLRPIDILQQKILMKIERTKYVSSNQEEQHQIEEDLWKCAELILNAMVISSEKYQYKRKRRNINIRSSTNTTNSKQGKKHNDCSTTKSSQQRKEKNVLEYNNNDSSLMSIINDGGISEDDEPLCCLQPIIHTCLLLEDECPLSLWELALIRYPDQLKLFDSYGRLPLHIVSLMKPATQHQPSSDTNNRVCSNNINNTANNNNDDQNNFVDDEEHDIGEELLSEEEDRLKEILHMYPDATHIKDKAHYEIPLKIAIRAGRTWNTGVYELIKVYPASILFVFDDGIESSNYEEISLKLYPLIIHKVLSKITGISVTTTKNKGNDRKKSGGLQRFFTDFFQLQSTTGDTDKTPKNTTFTYSSKVNDNIDLLSIVYQLLLAKPDLFRNDDNI